VPKGFCFWESFYLFVTFKLTFGWKEENMQKKLWITHEEVTMRMIKTLGLIALVLTVVAGSTQMANAGVEPSPFKPEINKLNAFDNHLTAIQEIVNRVLACPPDGSMTGTVRRLSAMDRQLYLLDASLESLMEEVMGTQPDDQHDWNDVAPALTSVKDTAQGIVRSIDESYLDCSPDDQRLVDALEQISLTADMLVENANQYIRDLSGEVDCGELTEGDCNSSPPCKWNEPTGTCY
jgi:hypothetical protein